MREVSLPSGSVLKVQAAPFADAKALYQAVLDEIRFVEITSAQELMNVFKNIVCVGFSSKKIDLTLEQCFKRCTYNDSNIDKNTFEAVDRRVDYIPVCMEVLKENLEPFTKSLMQEYQRFLSMIPSVPA